MLKPNLLCVPLLFRGARYPFVTFKDGRDLAKSASRRQQPRFPVSIRRECGRIFSNRARQPSMRLFYD
jgi:hypothetical protein